MTSFDPIFLGKQKDQISKLSMISHTREIALLAIFSGNHCSEEGIFLKKFGGVIIYFWGGVVNLHWNIYKGGPQFPIAHALCSDSSPPKNLTPKCWPPKKCVSKNICSCQYFSFMPPGRLSFQVTAKGCILTKGPLKYRYGTLHNSLAIMNWN